MSRAEREKELLKRLRLALLRKLNAEKTEIRRARKAERQRKREGRHG